MLTITVPGTEQWDEGKQEFVYTKQQTLQLEHSLVSISKWESKWHKAFLGKREKTVEETLDYVRCMTLTQNVNPDVYRCLTAANLETIDKYIADPMTATHTPERSGGKKSGDTVTSELIYYWMISFNIPVEFQKWHLNRLLTLIRVCEMKNAPSKKMGRNDLLRRNASLNAARRKQYHTSG